MEFRIKELRQSRRWNQTTLAYHAGMSTSQISLIESGKRNPSAASLQSIADALGVSISDLFPKLPGDTETRLERFLAEAREMPTDELARRNSELSKRLIEMVRDPVGLPRKLGGQAPSAETAQHLRELGKAADEAHAVAQALRERAAQQEAAALAQL
jgi:transcriptional regulator with XRE-family HTH domain